jgi:hypothetical protein
MSSEYRMFPLPFRVSAGSVCMASLADLYTFQAVVSMYINAAMQRYAVLRPGGDGSSANVVHSEHKNEQ